jgi:O-antigen ligase
MLLLASLLYTFKGELIETVSVRLLIWSHFFNIFIPNFYSGLGFGGWLPSFMANADSYGITAAFPPHNVFIATWAESGVSALMVLVIFYYYLISFSFKLLRSEGRELRGLGVAVLFSSLWILLHGMGENFGPIGEDHMFVLHAVVLGYSYARYKKRC